MSTDIINPTPQAIDTVELGHTRSKRNAAANIARITGVLFNDAMGLDADSPVIKAAHQHEDDGSVKFTDNDGTEQTITRFKLDADGTHFFEIKSRNDQGTTLIEASENGHLAVGSYQGEGEDFTARQGVGVADGYSIPQVRRLALDPLNKWHAATSAVRAERGHETEANAQQVQAEAAPVILPPPVA